MAQNVEMTENNQEVYLFLNRLRESGETNMFGAAPYIVDEFGCDKYEARSLLADWMKWVSENPPNRDL